MGGAFATLRCLADEQDEDCGVGLDAGHLAPRLRPDEGTAVSDEGGHDGRRVCLGVGGNRPHRFTDGTVVGLVEEVREILRTWQGLDGDALGVVVERLDVAECCDDCLVLRCVDGLLAEGHGLLSTDPWFGLVSSTVQRPTIRAHAARSGEACHLGQREAPVMEQVGTAHWERA